MILLVGLLLLALVIAPILAIAAWVRVRRLEDNRPQQQVPPEAYFSNLTARIYQLEKKFEQLEQRLAGIAAEPSVRPAAPAPSPATAPAPPAPVAPPGSQPPEPHTAGPSSARPVAPIAPPPMPAPPMYQPMPKGELESMIAGSWLNRIGIASVLFAVAYFLKYAFDNQWIGPTGQVAIGIFFGAGLLVFAHWLLGRGYLYFSEGIVGMGASVLYLSLWAACSYYTPPVMSRDMAFVAMIAVSAAMLAIAIGRDSQRVAALALAGGFITPMLVSTGQDAQIVLFSYLLILNSGLLVFAHQRNWRWLEGPALVFTLIYFWGWYDQFYRDEKLLITVFFATLFFALFSAIPVIRVRRTAQLQPEQALYIMMHKHYLWPLTLATLGLAALHLVIVQLMPPVREGDATVARLLFAGLALTFATLVIPIRLEGKWITIAWAIEGAVLMWTGFRTRVWYLRASAFVLFAIVGARLLMMPMPLVQAFANERFASFAVALVCFAIALIFWKQDENQSEVEPGEETLFAVLGIAFNVLAVFALTIEMRNAFFTPGMPWYQGDARLKYGLSVSLLWTLYAAVLLFLGMRWSEAGMRWQALILFGIVIVKVFFGDLSSLQGVYRIFSFVVLGLVLLGVSFFYQKKLAEKKRGG